MFKRSFVRLFILPALALTTVFLFSSVCQAQKGPQGTTGAPLKGVDVKLGKNPGGQAAARTITDVDGNFSFPVVPAGEYILTLELKKDMTGAQVAKSSSTSTDAKDKLCYITLKLPGGSKIEKAYDLAQDKAFDPAINASGQSASKRKYEPFIVQSDGATPLNGTIIKSKSNITNN